MTQALRRHLADTEPLPGVLDPPDRPSHPASRDGREPAPYAAVGRESEGARIAEGLRLLAEAYGE